MSEKTDITGDSEVQIVERKEKYYQSKIEELKSNNKKV